MAEEAPVEEPPVPKSGIRSSRALPRVPKIVTISEGTLGKWPRIPISNPIWKMEILQSRLHR